MTALLNHNTIMETLEIECKKALLLNMPLAIVMIDIDHFKQVNDLYGHPVGDQVTMSLSNLLLERLRRVDKIGRYGGEEFMVILPNTTVAEAALVMEGLRVDFGSIVHYSENGQPFQKTFSAGVVEFTTGLSSKALVGVADKLLYHAKRNGRNQIHFSSGLHQLPC